MHWAVPYVGIPTKAGARGPFEVDCWGLLRLIYQDRFSVLLPDLPGISTESVQHRTSVIHQEMLRDWTEIPAPFDGCAVGLSQRICVHHVGVFVKSCSGPLILHAIDGGVVAENLQKIDARGFRTVKYYQHRLWPMSSK